MSLTPRPEPGAEEKRRRALEYIEEQLRRLHYGELRIVVQGGRIAQIEATERKQF